MAEPKNTVKNTLKEKEEILDTKTSKEPKAKKDKVIEDTNKVSFSEKINNFFRRLNFQKSTLH